MGFMTADVLAERWSVAFADHKGLAKLGKGAMDLGGHRIKFLLAKPLTYMNDSGDAVSSIATYYGIAADRIVVIHDDMDLEFGRIKVKRGGSAGATTVSSRSTVPCAPMNTLVSAWAWAMLAAARMRTTTPSIGCWVVSPRNSALRCPIFWRTAPTPSRR